MTQLTQYFPLGGGLDLITPAIATPAGRLIAAENYESHPRGYARIEGFERFDGRPKPSEAKYWILNFTSGTAPIAEGNTVTGATSGATGKALTAPVVESGSYGGGDAAGFLVLTNVTGTFQDNETLYVSDILVTWNPADKGANVVLSNGNKTAFTDVAVTGAVRATAGIDVVNEARYFEFEATVGGSVTNLVAIGIANSSHDLSITNSAAPNVRTYASNGQRAGGGTGSTYGSAWNTGSPTRIGVAIRSGSIWFAQISGGVTTWQGGGDPVGGTNPAFSGLTGIWYPYATDGSTTRSLTVDLITDPAGMLGTVPNGFTAGPFAVADGPALENGADNDTNDETWLRDAIEKARSAIGQVPGSGRIRGVWVYNGDVYAFRDNAGGTACVMHKATASGWQAQDLGRSLSFSAGGGYRLAFTSGGTYEPQVGDEIEGETSEASAIIVAIDLTSGTWAGGDAAGTLLLKDKAGTFEAENIKVGANANIATIAGDATTLKIEEGDTIVGATSGAEAVVERVVLSSGAWDDANAVGRLILSGQTGTFEAEALNIDGGASEVATIAGDSSEITLPVGGRYEFVNHNFYGASNLRRMYGCNGVGPAFEWDGSVFVPIHTGMETDTPHHIAVHKNHLFLSFPGGSAQHSAIGDPYLWSVVLGAGEIAIGEDITGFTADVAGVLIIWGRNKVCVLYGDDSDNWELKTLTDEAGAVEWTAQRVGNPIYLDDRGLRNLTTTQAFGDFRMGTISQLIEPLFASKRQQGIKPIASLRVRTKDMYRLFWDDGTGISVYLGRKQPEIMPFNLGKVVYCCCSSEDAEGNEVLFFGSDDGYVYQLDKGTSFDGRAVVAYGRFPFNHVGSPTQKKRWHKVTLEIDAEPSVQLGVIAEFSYGDPNQPPSVEQSFDVRGGGGFWNAANWDQFYWSSPVEGLAECHIDGLGRNISIAVVSEAIYEEPHIIHGMTLHFTYRGLAR